MQGRSLVRRLCSLVEGVVALEGVVGRMVMVMVMVGWVGLTNRQGRHARRAVIILASLGGGRRRQFIPVLVSDSSMRALSKLSP